STTAASRPARPRGTCSPHPRRHRSAPISVLDAPPRARKPTQLRGTWEQAAALSPLGKCPTPAATFCALLRCWTRARERTPQLPTPQDTVKDRSPLPARFAWRGAAFSVLALALAGCQVLN